MVRNYNKELVDESIWIVGNQSKVNYWKANWIGYPIVSKINAPDNIPINVLVGNFIHDNRWKLPQSFYDAFPNIVNDIRNVSIAEKTADELRWRHCADEADALDTGTMHNSVSDLLILKMFQLKVNIDSAANESPGMTVELMGVICIVEYAKQHHWNYLWLDCDSVYVVNLIKPKNKLAAQAVHMTQPSWWFNAPQFDAAVAKDMAGLPCYTFCN
ncbi:hypothetical protein TIFTF001_024597 [Ficus carica]|uniref:Uncharacterized protein n=1 Tax=Ficus carica TaxID=3494 RepID=A0AA88DGY6_FICCA|nr:hypothetical protein TIFTF001_024597 [Ficus carica]